MAMRMVQQYYRPPCAARIRELRFALRPAGKDERIDLAPADADILQLSVIERIQLRRRPVSNETRAQGLVPTQCAHELLQENCHSGEHLLQRLPARGMSPRERHTPHRSALFGRKLPVVQYGKIDRFVPHDNISIATSGSLRPRLNLIK
jgi:hypothetical protein